MIGWWMWKQAHLLAKQRQERRGESEGESGGNLDYDCDAFLVYTVIVERWLQDVDISFEPKLHTLWPRNERRLTGEVYHFGRFRSDESIALSWVTR